MNMNIEDLTIKQAKELATLFGMPSKGKSTSLSVGESVFIRTVTHYYTGKIDAITDSDLVLSTAAWVASTGRFSAALKTGVLDEVEPFPFGVTVSRDSIIDNSPWKHPLPTEVK